MTRVKICCITSLDEAKLAVDAGASAIGLVSEMPSGPGVISESQIAEIAKSVPPAVSSFLLTSKQSVNSIIDQHRRCKTNVIQICDRIISGDYHYLKISLPGIKIVQVIHIEGEKSLDEAILVSKKVDALLLDSGNRNSEIKELGGTGRTHNWEVSKKIVKAVLVPVFLAGGLNSENIVEAVKYVKPFGVDVCSGVRSKGKLDKSKVKKFIERVNSI